MNKAALALMVCWNFLLPWSLWAETAERTQEFRQVTGPVDFVFPRDHGAHRDYATEWWYFTGHLAAADGAEFGFELTFFRIGIMPPPASSLSAARSSWRTDSIYFAHLALTDDLGRYLPPGYGSADEVGRFYATERRSRGALGHAGAAPDRLDVKIDKLSATQDGTGIIRLKSDDPLVSFELPLVSKKPPVFQGENGFSRKGPALGQASLYYSLPRLSTECSSDCKLVIDGKNVPLRSATVWMDREITSNKLDSETLGWDWFAVELNDGSDLMVYQLRGRDGKKSPFSSGSISAPDGTVRTLSADDFRIVPQGNWRSAKSGVTYPSGWKVEVPKLGYDLTVSPTVKNQELQTSGTTGVTYWEGRCLAEQSGKPVGRAYVELVGYR